MTDSADAQQVSWRAITYRTPVVAADGTSVGLVREVLGSDAEDIFHGIRVGLAGEKRDVFLSSDLVSALTDQQVTTSLTAVAVEGLPTYSDEATYHLASVGWLRKHLGWARDSGKDEEPG